MRCIWVGRSFAWLLSLVLTTGCALGAQGPNPNRPAGTPPSCTTQKTVVTADWIAAGAGVTVGVASANANARLATALIASSGLLAVSAIAGNRRVNECRNAYETYFVARAIQRPDSYGEYALVAEREAKRLRPSAKAIDRPVAKGNSTVDTATNSVSRAESNRIAPRRGGAAPVDATSPDPDKRDEAPVEDRWGDFWSEQR